MRILILRTSALGDIVHALPVLSALRRELPEARIGWVVESAFAELLEGHGDLDHVIVVQTRSWRHRVGTLRTWREMGAAVRQMRRFAPTVALDLMGNHKAGILARLSGADTLLGARRNDRREPSSALWIGRGIVLEGDHVVDRNLSLLRSLSLEPGAVDFGGDRLLAAAAGAAESELAEAATDRVVLHPGAGWGSKRWPPTSWGRLVRLLASEGVQSLLVCAPEEEGLAQAVLDASDGSLEARVVPGLRRLAAVQARAQMVIAGDTGPLHLAHALGRPVVAIMGPTDPERHGPYGKPGRAVWRQLPCSFCYQRFAETKACLHEVTPEMVRDRALQVLAGER